MGFLTLHFRSLFQISGASKLNADFPNLVLILGMQIRFELEDLSLEGWYNNKY